ncbi:MAG: hypothetical protein ACRCZJ_01045 [Erysipelotrichaceae bacterium]
MNKRILRLLSVLALVALIAMGCSKESSNNDYYTLTENQVFHTVGTDAEYDYMSYLTVNGEALSEAQAAKVTIEGEDAVDLDTLGAYLLIYKLPNDQVVTFTVEVVAAQ